MCFLFANPSKYATDMDRTNWQRPAATWMIRDGFGQVDWPTVTHLATSNGVIVSWDPTSKLLKMQPPTDRPAYSLRRARTSVTRGMEPEVR